VCIKLAFLAPADSNYLRDWAGARILLLRGGCIKALQNDRRCKMTGAAKRRCVTGAACWGALPGMKTFPVTTAFIRVTYGCPGPGLALMLPL
jgi:hypothetical protein